MPDTITTSDFPELGKYHATTRGTYPEFANRREARVAFARAMLVRGYRLGANRTWLKARCAAVIEPR